MEYLEMVKVTKTKGTYNFYKGKIDVLIQFFKNYEIEDITKKDVIAFWTWRKKIKPNITNTSLNKFRQTIILIVRYHLEYDINIDKLKQTKKLIEVIDNHTKSSVLEYLNDYYMSSINFSKEALRNLVIFYMLNDTGLRINELLNLKVNDFKFSENTIHVKVTKTRNERYVFFTSPTKVLIKKLITRDRTKDYLFKSYQSGKQLTVDNVESICFRIEKKLKLSSTIRPHKWRHTFATNYLKKGGDLETLRLILGHSSIKTTQRYLHFDHEHIRKEYFKTIN